jgi:hypothetical protein
MENEIGESVKLGIKTRLALRIEPKMLWEIDKLSGNGGISRSDVARLLIAEGLKHLTEIKLVK